MQNTSAQKIIRDAVASYATASKLALAGSILGFGVVGVTPAQAASLTNSTGISNPATTITFSEIPLADGTALTNQYASLGVTFTGLFFDTVNSGLPNITLPAANNSGSSSVGSPFLISFLQPQSQAAFSLVSSPGTSTFEALFNNSVVDTFSTATTFNSTNNFYGFTGVTFDAIRVTTVSGSNAAAIDNIQFTPATAQSVPEPFSIIGTLVGGTAAFRLRKKLVGAKKM